MRRWTMAAAGMLLFAAAAAGQGPADGFPAGPGHDTFVRVCSGCHELGLVSAKRLDRSGWDEMVHVMIDRGAVATDAEAAEVADYLARTYPPR